MRVLVLAYLNIALELHLSPRIELRKVILGLSWHLLPNKCCTDIEQEERKNKKSKEKLYMKWKNNRIYLCNHLYWPNQTFFISGVFISSSSSEPYLEFNVSGKISQKENILLDIIASSMQAMSGEKRAMDSSVQ